MTTPTTALAHLQPASTPDGTPRPDRGAIDLLALILDGLLPRSAQGYREDYAAFARHVGAPSAEDALAGLLTLDLPRANALLADFQAAMATLAPATIRRRVAALTRAFRRARLVGLTHVAPEAELPRAEAFRDTAGPGAHGWEQLLARAEAEAATGVAGPVRNRAILLVLHDRALRRGELVALNYPEDLDAGRPAVQVRGKGHRVKHWLTINERTRAALVAWLRLRGDAPGPLFTRADRAARGPARLTGDAVNRMVQAVARRAGLTRPVRPHGLRHQAITAALEAGWDVRDVRHYSRHSKVDTVLVYDDRRKDVGGAITRAMGRPARRARRGG